MSAVALQVLTPRQARICAAYSSANLLTDKEALELVCRAASRYANGATNARQILQAVAIVRKLARGKAKR